MCVICCLLIAKMNGIKDKEVESRTREWFHIKKKDLPKAEDAFMEVARKYYLCLPKKQGKD